VANPHAEFPYPGIAVRTNPHGIKLVFLHYSADPDKGNGEKKLVPEIGLALSPWARGGPSYEATPDNSKGSSRSEVPSDRNPSGLDSWVRQASRLAKRTDCPNPSS